MFDKHLVLPIMAIVTIAIHATTSDAQILDATAREISVQAHLTDAKGVALPDGPHQLDFFFYDGPKAIVAVGSILNIDVTTVGGIMAARVGPLDAAMFAGGTIWVGMTVDDADDDPTGDELSPRIPFGAVPYAFRADRVENEELTDDVDLGNATNAGSMRVFNGTTSSPNVVIDGPLSRIDLLDSSPVASFVGVRVDGLTNEVLVNGDDGQRDAWLRSLPFEGGAYGQLLLYDSTENTRTVFLTARTGSGSGLTMSDTNGDTRFRVGAAESGGFVLLHDSNDIANLTLTGTNSRIDSQATRLSLNTVSSEDVTLAAGGGNVAIGHSSPDSLLHLASLGGIDLIIDADTNNIGEDQNARLVMRQDGGQVAARVGFRDGDNSLEIMQEFGDSLILGTNNSDRMTISSGGNVGIGTSQPNHELVVQGNDPSMQIRDDTGINSANAARLELLESAGGNFDGGAFFWWNGETNKLLIGTKVNGDNTNVLVVDRATSSVGIGTQNPGNFRLAVNGRVRAKEIVVDTGWSDFVFEPSYQLLSLPQVEAHISKHGHLPEIPSAKEVAEQGVKVGEMHSKLLQKVEELTLHLIDMDKRIKSLERENNQLRYRANQNTAAREGAE
jgi:hypothetical protein